MSEPMVFRAYYEEPYNAIVQPHKPMFYFSKRWMGELGPTATSIVLFLRAECLGSIDKGNTCQFKFDEIGKGIGVSRATVVREMGTHQKEDLAKGIHIGDFANPTLQQFVHAQNVKTLTDAGVRNGANAYVVRLDDPIHPDDMALYELLCKQQEERKTQEEAGGKTLYRDLRTGQKGNLSPAAQIEPQAKHNPPAAQNEPLDLRGKSTPAAQIEPYIPNVLFTNVSTLNVIGGDRNNKSRNRNPNAGAPNDVIAQLIQNYVSKIIEVTGDTKSERRYYQLVGICETNNVLSIVDVAVKATAAGIEAVSVPKPGAYLQKIVLTQLGNRNIHVPTAQEKATGKDIAAAIADGLGGKNPFACSDPGATTAPPAAVTQGPAARPGANSKDELAQIAALQQGGGPAWADWCRFVEEERQEIIDLIPRGALRDNLIANFNAPEKQRSRWAKWTKKRMG